MIVEFLRCINEEDTSFYFKTININSKEYEQRILTNNGELITWNCTCPFGSAFRFSKKYEGQDKRCRHAEECINLLKYLGYINGKEVQILETEQTG